MIRTINPTTGETIHEFEPHSHERIERILNGA